MVSPPPLRLSSSDLLSSAAFIYEETSLFDAVDSLLIVIDGKTKELLLWLLLLLHLNISECWPGETFNSKCPVVLNGSNLDIVSIMAFGLVLQFV